MSDNRTVHLVSNEGESFDVPLNAAKLSELVKTMLDEEAEDADDIQEIPLPNVKSTVLALVIEFLRHQIVEPMNDIEKVRKEPDSEMNVRKYVCCVYLVKQSDVHHWHVFVYALDRVFISALHR